MEAMTIAGTDTLSAIETSNQQHIQRYITQVKLGNIGERRDRKLRYTLGTIGTWLQQDFLDVTKQDIAECISALKGDVIVNPKSDEPYEFSIKVTFLKILKPFFCWIRPEVGPVAQPNGQVIYENVFAGWIKTGNYSATVGPEDILTDDERSILYELCKTPRDKALFQTLYESAARPFEMLALMRSDIEFDHDSVFYPHSKRERWQAKRHYTPTRRKSSLTRLALQSSPATKQAGRLPRLGRYEFEYNS